MTLWYYRPEKNQVVVRDIGTAFVNQTPLLFLFGKGDLAAEFRWEEKDLAPGDGGLMLLELLPRSRKYQNIVSPESRVRPGNDAPAFALQQDRLKAHAVAQIQFPERLAVKTRRDLHFLDAIAFPDIDTPGAVCQTDASRDRSQSYFHTHEII